MTVLILCLALVLIAGPADAGPLGGLIVAGFKAFFTASALIATALRAAVAIGVSLLARRRAKKKQRPAGLQTTFTTKGGTDPQGTVIGWYATAGHVIYRNSYNPNNATLIEIIELGDIPGVSLRRVMIDGVVSELEPNRRPGYQSVIVKNYNGENYTVLRFYDGTQTEADPRMVEIFGSRSRRPWTPDHILTGTPYVLVSHHWHRGLFRNGKPEMRFELDGIPFYDPRADSTVGGTGPQRWNDKSTWQQTDNAIVLVYNIMRGLTTPTGEVWGGAAEADDLPLSNWFAAMNVCDLPVGDTNRPQFRAGFEIRFEEEPASVVEELLTACNAQISEIGGVWTVQVGAPQASVVHITDDDILVSEPAEFDPFPGLEATHNAISVSHPTPDGLWNASSLETITNPEWEAEDGGQRLFELRLPVVPWAEQARQVAQNMIRDERRFRTHKIVLPGEYYWLKTLMTITWTSPWNSYDAKLFEITDAAYDVRTMNVSLSLRERDPDDFTHDDDLELPDAPQETTGITVVDAGVPDFTVSPYSGLDGDGEPRRPGILATWDGSIADTSDGLSFELRVTGQTELSWAGDLSEIDGGQFALVGLLRATDYQMRAKAIARVRQTVWTGWQDVRTPDIGFDPADLSDRTWDAIHSDATAIASALSQDATISDLEALLEGHRDREQTARNVALATEDLQALVKDTGEAVATARQELSAQIERNVASLVTLNKARADGESALAQAISALTTTVGDQSATLSEHATSLDGMFLEKMIRLDNNGHVSGLVLRSERDEAGATVSDAAFVADRFAIVGPGDTPQSPFVVYTTPQVIDGIAVPPGVYMRDAFIRNGMIGRAQVRDTIESDNYAEDANGRPTAGMKLDFADGEIKTYGVVMSRPMVLASGSFTYSGTANDGARWQFVNTGIRVGAADVWQAGNKALVATAAITTEASAPGGISGYDHFWSCRTEILPGARWHGWVGGNPQPGTAYRQDPALMVDPYWASGNDQRVFLDIMLETVGGVYFSNPTIQWVVFEVT